MIPQIHFIGLGGAGCNALEHIYRQGIHANYTCISYPERPELPADIHFIKYARLSKWHLFEAGNLFKENSKYLFNINELLIQNIIFPFASKAL